MNTKFILPILAILSISACIFLQNQKDNTPMPIPTNGKTIVKINEEEGENQDKRSAWFELMHQSAPTDDWRSMEYETAMKRHKKRAAARKSGAENTKNGQEVLADGQLIGEWLERGSNNQSGSVFAPAYDQLNDRIYIISAGGTLFKGKRDGSYWEVINQDLRLSPHLLKIINVNGQSRMLALVNRVPHYSDDMGLTWTAATGISYLDDWDNNYRDPIVVEHNGGYQIYLLAKTSYWNPVHLYVSEDNGASYEAIANWTTNEMNDFSLCNPHHTDEVYLYEKVGTSSSKFSQINKGALTVNELFTGGFDIGNAEANMTGTMMPNGATRFYIYDDNRQVFRTESFGEIWTVHGNMPTDPWGVGIYASKYNPSLLVMGEVECHRTETGFFWEKINDWGAYYDNVKDNLHADIMFFEEFETTDGEEFMLVSNHGGLSISYDDLVTVDNIGMQKLNVSQYYDVRTDPLDRAIIYAGAQDQGFQRGAASNDRDIINFDQVISGDYGHIAFSNQGQSLWTVYPGGWVSYYSNAQFGGITSDYTIESENETVWIPPVIETPDFEDNAVLVAGGSKDGGAGSYIIKMKIWAGSVQAEHLPFDFYDASGGEVSAIGVSSINPDIMYASTTNSFFYYSLDAGQTWEQSFVLVPGPHYLYGASIYASKIEENTVYIGGSGYSNASVYKSTDNGMTFEPMNEGLPNTLVFEITANEDESFFFAATEAGPYVYVVADEMWYDMSGLAAPNQTYWSVEYLEDLQTIRFGTYGRGIWDFQMQELVNTKDLDIAADIIDVFPNPVWEYANVRLKQSIQGTYSILDMSGRKLQEHKITNTEFRVDMRKQASGMYVLKIETANGIYTKKLIKE